MANPLHPSSHPSASPLDVAALVEMADGLARVIRSVPAGAGAHDSPRSIRLLGTASYDAWLITWPPGSSLAHHDHGGSTGVLQVVSGVLVETGDRLSGSRTLEAGASSVTASGAGHRLVNASAAETTTIHAYSPPLELLGFDADPVTAARSPGASPPMRATKAVRRRRAEATSLDVWSEG